MPPGFKAKLGFKDIHLALEAAEVLQVPMPVASHLRDRFLTLLATGAATSIGRRWLLSPLAMRASHRRFSLRSHRYHRGPDSEVSNCVNGGSRWLPWKRLFGMLF